MVTGPDAANCEAIQCIQEAYENDSRELLLANLPLERLPSELVKLTTLTTLRIEGCLRLKDISLIRCCTGLEILELCECPQVENLEPLWGLKSLTELHIRASRHDFLQDDDMLSALVDIDGLTELRGLLKLVLHGCNRISLSEPLTALAKLHYLEMSYCDQLVHVQPLAALTTLRYLILSGCEQLVDVQPLAALTTLKHLDLSGCEQLVDVQPLAALTTLKHLDLSRCEQLVDVRPLTALTTLQYLDLSWCKGLVDVQPLAALTTLQHLNLRACEQLVDVQPLASLTTLQHLNLQECKQLVNIQPLTALTTLESLHLNWCEQLGDLRALAALGRLQSFGICYSEKLLDAQLLAALAGVKILHLSGCGELVDLQSLTTFTKLHRLVLGGCEQLVDLQPLDTFTTLLELAIVGSEQLADVRPLAALTTLQYLNLNRCKELVDVQPLAALTALRRLDLQECKQLENIQPLATLTSLEHLDLSYCELLVDLQPLAALTELKTLRMVSGSAIDCSPGAIPLAAWHCLNELYCNRLIAAPSELGSRRNYDNILPRVRAWQDDLSRGEAPNSSVKVFVLGNGRIGKTQVCRRLRGEMFDTCIPSTHGISLDKMQLANSTPQFPAVDANVWDFGGQDIYLGTHALFLDERSIYVIAWTPKYEDTREFEEDGVPMRNRPLTYWLEYVCSLAGPSVPVIVVQTQCDSELDNRPPPIRTDYKFARLRTVSASAKTEDGIERLQLELKSAARFQVERYGKVRLPTSWVAVSEDLQARIDKKMIPRSEFDQICHTKHGSSMPDVVLEYLHQCGLVFWRDGLFDNNVVLDLAWALDGVYAVLDRNLALPEIRRAAGRFSSQLLAAVVWRDHTQEERTHFLALMEQCQICFKVTDDLFIAPALLPSEAATQAAMQKVWRKAVPDTVVNLDYRFLHEGILRAMLCGIGNRAGLLAVYWSYGVCYYDTKHKSTVRIRTDLSHAESGQAGGSIVVETTGSNASFLAAQLADSIEKLNIGQPPQVIWVKGRAERFKREQIVEAVNAEIDQNSLRAPRKAFEEVTAAPPPRLTNEALPVYVSYAWGGESQDFVDKIENRLSTDFALIRDVNKVRPGDWISSFMTEIGRSDLVLVVLSDKYLRSVYCMRELLHLYNRSLGDREHLMRRMVPLIVGDLKCHRVVDRDPYVTHWEQEHARVESVLKTRTLGSVGEADRSELLAIQDFHHRISDMLAWVADTLMPRGAELYTEGIDAAIELLHRRASDRGS